MQKMTTAQFLALPTRPARLDAFQAASILGFEEHHIPILVKYSLLTPLGHPAANAQKFFDCNTIEELAADPKWLHRATEAVNTFFKKKNEAKKKQKQKKTPPTAPPAP